MKHLLKVFAILISIAFTSQAFSEIVTDPVKLEQLKVDLQRRSSGLVSDTFNRRMDRISREMSREDFDRAIELLEGLLEVTAGNDYENAMALQNLGFAYIQNEQSQKGLETLQKALDANALPYGPTLNLIYVLGQVNLAEGQHDRALAYFKQWFVLTNEVTSDAYILKGAVYAEKEEFARALELVEKGLAMTDSPQEAWLSFAAGLYYQNEKYEESAEIFKRLAEAKPDEKRYWVQLSGILATMEKDHEALSAMQMNEKMELLSEERDYFSLCGLYNYTEIPINCARLLEKAMEKDDLIEDRKRANELLSRAYIQAREPERAIAPLEELAAQDDTGEFEMEIGMIHYRAHEWEKAIEMLDTALEKGGLEDRKLGNLLLSKGISEYQVGKYSQSMESFNQLEQLESHKSHAQAWLSQVKQKLQ